MLVTKKKLEEQEQVLVTVRGVIGVYEEVAAERMQRIRGSVLTGRQFLEGLRRVLVEMQEELKHQPEWRGILPRNGKKAAVLVAANSGFYGDMLIRIFRQFAEFAALAKADMVVLGRVGRRMLEEQPVTAGKVHYFDIKDDQVEDQELAELMKLLTSYQDLTIFHGQFESVVNQKVVGTSLSAGERLVGEEAGSGARYIFEPSWEEMVEVFEGEVLGAVVGLVLYEAYLAKFAARMMHLDRSMDKIERAVKDLQQSRLRFNHRWRNKRQQSQVLLAAAY